MINSDSQNLNRSDSNKQNLKKKSIIDIFEAKNPKKSNHAYKLSMITAYDATSARLCERAGVDIILVGDTLGMTMQGHDDTNGVSMDEMIYHTKIVVKNAPSTFIVADMPFLSYEVSVEDALYNAGRFFKESGVRAVKMEGAAIVPQIKALTEAGIPVMGHLGLTPQRSATLGGFKAQARNGKSAFKLLNDAKLLEEAGCFSLVLEAIPPSIAKYISEAIKIPTIGIGAGNACDGQVIVFHDMLGFSDFVPRFVKKYAELGDIAQNAIEAYINDVKNINFPSEEHTYLIADEELQEFLKHAKTLIIHHNPS